MATNLLKQEFPVSVFDISQPAIQKATEQGAKSSSIKEIAETCDVVVTMLPTPSHVKSVYCDDNGLLSNSRPNTLFIDSSTIDPTTSRDVAEEAKKAGSVMVDAPVSGGVVGAEAGTLTFMVGGSDEAHDRAKHVLQHMGKNIVHCGGSGTGQVAKVCNNLVLAISMVGVSEGMNLGVKGGMDPKVLAGIFNTSTARCWSTDTYNPCPGVIDGVPSSKGYQGGFAVDLMKKDLGLAIQAANDAKTSIPLGQVATQLYTQVSEKGEGKKDFSVVYDCLKNDKFD